MRMRNARTLAAAALVPLLAVAGCGTTTKPKSTSSPAPTGDVHVPQGVDITKPGADLRFGDKAVVAYEPNPKKNTVLELTVLSATKGSIRDLSMYTLDQRTRASVPYYVKVKVTNLGDGDVGRSPVPLWGVDRSDTLLQASSFTNTFAKCPSRPLPASFAPNDSVSTCLVYLVPDHGKLTGVSFRPLQAYEPIEWTGDIATPKATPKKKHPKKKPAKKR